MSAAEKLSNRVIADVARKRAKNLRLKAYPEYKDSGFEWLGNIPSHWRLGKLGVCFEERNEKVSDEDFAPLSVTKSGIVPQMEHVAKTDAGDNRKKVCVNDFVINSRSDRKGSAGISIYEGSVSLISIVLKPREHHPSFVHHLFRSYNFQEEFYRYGKGIVADLWSTRYAEMKSISVPLLPMDEQVAIANYLDRETARIDNLIAEKQKFIDLLKEKRQTLISRVVTKGLDSKTKMKDSGIEWIGEVPEHWRISKLKWLTYTESGSTPSTDNYGEYYDGGTIPWIRTTDLNNSELYEVPIKITEAALKRTACSIVPKGSVLVAMYGGAGSIGKHSLLMFDSSINQAVCAILPCKMLLPEFLHLFVEYCRPFWMLGADGTRKDPNINQDVVKNLSVPIPPTDEQNRIIAYFMKRARVIEQLISDTNESVELLKEHRTALISAAVTGKIDVRNQL